MIGARSTRKTTRTRDVASAPSLRPASAAQPDGNVTPALPAWAALGTATHSELSFPDSQPGLQDRRPSRQGISPGISLEASRA